MSAVLLDTSVVIDPTNLDAWKGSVALVSAVTLGELHAGLEMGDAVIRAERRGRLNHVRATYQAIPFGDRQAEVYGVLVTLMLGAGRSHRRRALDLQIAATAAVAGVPLLTRNAADLVGLERVVRVIGI